MELPRQGASSCCLAVGWAEANAAMTSILLTGQLCVTHKQLVHILESVPG